MTLAPQSHRQSLAWFDGFPAAKAGCAPMDALPGGTNGVGKKRRKRDTVKEEEGENTSLTRVSKSYRDTKAPPPRV